jgi:hypothetical protein
VAAILAQRAARGTFRHLWDSEVSVFSQWGEDGILDYLCEALDMVKPKALELGVGNYTECNTRFLAHYRSASVVAVDGRNDLIDTIGSLDLRWKTTIMALEQWITPDNVQEICAQARDFMGDIDILSLDIDGNDYWVAEAIDLTTVRMIVVEYNPVFGAGDPVSVPRNDTFNRSDAHYSCLYYGASLRAFIDLFSSRGFDLVGTNRVGSNAFFVRRNEASFDQLVLPDPQNLDRYVDWRVRESRSVNGELTFLTGSARREMIEDLPLVNVNTRSLTNLASLRM